MSWWKRIFGGDGKAQPKPAAPAPRRSKSLEEIKAELDANRVSLSKATAAAPRKRVKRPASGPLWKPVYAAARDETLKPTDLSRIEAVCFLVGATALYYEGDGLDNGLLGNFGEEEVAEAIPALKEIGAQPVAAVLSKLLGDLRNFRHLPGNEYFQKLAIYDKALAEAGIDDLLPKLDSYLAGRYPWA